MGSEVRDALVRPKEQSRAATGVVAGVLAVALALTVGPGDPGADEASAGPAPPDAPNIVVVMTDDQPTDTMAAMPITRRLLGRRGVTFRDAVTSFPLCCPSRATFLTGQYAHNHGVLDNHAPNGGLGRLDQQDVLPIWLADAGYETAFVGKYLNGYGARDLGGPRYVPPGWDRFYALDAESKRAAFNYRLNYNGDLRRVRGKYKTDELARIGAKTIRRSAGDDDPLFMWVATSAPHLDPDLERTARNPAPAPRHRGDFSGARPVRGPAFNEKDVSDKPASVRNLPRLTRDAKREIRKSYVSQLESILAIDEMVGRLVRELREAGELKDTLFVFTSDNGFMRGQHRIKSGKAWLYEESILVPLLVRGPGFPQGQTTRNPVGNVDFASTFMEAAGVEPPRPLDGVSLTGSLGPDGADREVLTEVFSERADPVRGLRSKRWVYAERDEARDELYDLAEDPFQLDNVVGKRGYRNQRQALSERLAELKDCAGADCR